MFSNKDYKDPFSHKKLKHSGFPSPANDYVENPINMNELLIKRASSTFLMRFKGNEMIMSGIKDNAILIIDRSLKPVNRNIIVASINGEFLCRRIIFGSKNNCTWTDEDSPVDDVSRRQHQHILSFEKKT